MSNTGCQQSKQAEPSPSFQRSILGISFPFMRPINDSFGSGFSYSASSARPPLPTQSKPNAGAPFSAYIATGARYAPTGVIVSAESVLEAAQNFAKPSKVDVYHITEATTCACGNMSYVMYVAEYRNKDNTHTYKDHCMKCAPYIVKIHGRVAGGVISPEAWHRRTLSN